jgi:uncharacterized membrane protein
MKQWLKSALMAVTGISVWSGVVLAAPAGPLKTAFTALFLLTVPGWLAWRLLVKNSEAVGAWPVLGYSTALSSLFLMLTGLAMSVILPPLGIAHPLETSYLVPAVAVGVGALAAGVIRRHGRIILPVMSLPEGPRANLTLAWGAALPVLSVAGAIILNNGGPGIVSLGMLGGLVGYAMWLLWPRRARNTGLYPYALFMMSLALLLATALRGWFITGHDIVQEYQVFQLTSQSGAWSMNLYHDAYTACLSITILPTILARLTGLADPYVYKVLFQAMFALVPVVLYQLLARFWPRRSAFLGALAFLTFPTFLTDMPMLCRQEMAFLYFGLMLFTLLNDKLSRRVRSGLVLLLGLGMILSHYSTSYVAVGIIIGAKVLELALRLASSRSQAKVDGTAASRVPGALTWPIALALALGVYLWNSQLTATSDGIAKTIAGVTVSLPQLFDRTINTGESSYSLVGKNLSSDQLFEQYRANVDRARDLPASSYYPDSVTEKYPLAPAQEQVAKTTPVGHVISAARVSPYVVFDAMKSGYAKLIQVLLILGLGIMLVRSKLSRLPLQYRLLGLAGMGMIVLEVLLPSAINYGLLRLLQQSLMMLAPAIVLALYQIFKWLKFSPTWRLRTTAALLLGFFAVNSGLLPAITGGYKPDLATANGGFYYAAYYTHADEIAGYQWLGQNAPKGSVVNADEFARRKMITYDGIYARASLAPAAISQDAYVYLSYGDTVFNQVPFYYNGQLLYEQPPTKFLDDNKNLLYSNGGVEIYK